MTDTDLRFGPAQTKRPLASLLGSFNVEGTVTLLLLAVAWQVASAHFPPFLFPSLPAIGSAIAELFTDAENLGAVGITYSRILIALAGSFVLSTAIGLLAAFSPRFERAILPVIELKQGVPGVCWIIFAILWFRDLEPRIAFVVITSTVPTFFYQARDGVRALPKDLWDMVRSFRPSRWQILTKLVFPALVPGILTGWRINIGAGTRVTVMAELLGGVSGMGHHLRLASELFRMDQAIAWTFALVLFVILSNLVLSFLEKRSLAWRPQRSNEGAGDH